MKKFIVNVNGTDYSVEVREEGAPEIKKNPVLLAPERKTEVPPVAPAPVVTVAPVEKNAVADSGGHSISAPMPGKIVKVCVTAGQAVRQGDVAVVLEAMKMQNEIKTPVDGTVKSVMVENGQTVKPGETMVIIA